MPAWFRRPTIRPWSRARSHINGRCNKDDPLTGVAVQEAGDLEAEGLAIADAIVIRLPTGRSPTADDWIDQNKSTLGRSLKPAKPGPKPKRGKYGGS